MTRAHNRCSVTKLRLSFDGRCPAGLLIALIGWATTTSVLADTPQASPAPTSLFEKGSSNVDHRPDEEVRLRVKLTSHQDFVGISEPLPAPPISPARTFYRDGCNTLGPGSPCPVSGFHCVGCPDCTKRGQRGWAGAGPIPWQAFAQGEYVGPARLAHMPVYRLRVDDILDFVFRLTRDASNQPYRLDVGDVIRIESLTAPELDQEALIEPDGSVSLRLLGQVRAYGLSMAEIRADLEEKYREHVNEPSISVAPVEINTRLEELRAAVDNRFGRGGQARPARVTPEGTVQLPAIGSVRAQGLTLNELQREIEARYSRIVQGLGVTPILQERAPRYVFVVGEVRAPGRYTLEGPTTLMQSIALAGGWNAGGNLQHVVVFRRDHNWNLMATKLNIFAALQGRQPCPADEIWIRDSDIVLVPKRAIRVANDIIELYFTRGLYGVIPANYSINFAKLSTI